MKIKTIYQLKLWILRNKTTESREKAREKKFSKAFTCAFWGKRKSS